MMMVIVIGDLCGLELLVPCVTQVKDFKLRQGWKAVYGKCVEKGIKREVAYYMDDDEETLVDRSEVVEGVCLSVNVCVSMRVCVSVCQCMCLSRCVSVCQCVCVILCVLGYARCFPLNMSGQTCGLSVVGSAMAVAVGYGVRFVARSSTTCCPVRRRHRADVAICSGGHVALLSRLDNDESAAIH